MKRDVVLKVIIEQEELEIINNIAKLYRKNTDEIAGMIYNTVSRGRMTFEGLEKALNEIYPTIYDLDDLNLVCECFKRLTLEGISLEKCTEWWLANVKPVRIPDIKEAIKSMKAILKQIELEEK